MVGEEWVEQYFHRYLGEYLEVLGLFLLSCLDHAGWNYEEAVKSFLQFRESIPKEGFRNS